MALLSLLIYGYATGVFSSRKLEPATCDSVVFRFIAANDHPDHDINAIFRRRRLPRIEARFVEVLKPAREMGVLQMADRAREGGTVALDGIKIHANASRHSALCYGHVGKIKAQLSAEVAGLRAEGYDAHAPNLHRCGCRGCSGRLRRFGWRTRADAGQSRRTVHWRQRWSRVLECSIVASGI